MKNNKKIFANITVGFQMGMTVAIFVYGGYRLDLYLNKTPVFLSIGAVLGMAAGFYHLLKELNQLNSDSSKEGDSDPRDNEKPRKWM